jgi:hypothetical protein
MEIYGFYKVSNSELCPTDHAKDFTLIIRKNLNFRSKSKKALYFNSPLGIAYNKRLSALYLVKKTKEKEIYKGDILTPFGKKHFILSISFASSIAQITEAK